MLKNREEHHSDDAVKKGYELRCEKLRCASLRSALQRCGALSCRHFSSQRRVCGVVNLGGVVKILRPSDSLSVVFLVRLGPLGRTCQDNQHGHSSVFGSVTVCVRNGSCGSGFRFGWLLCENAFLSFSASAQGSVVLVSVPEKPGKSHPWTNTSLRGNF